MERFQFMVGTLLTVIVLAMLSVTVSAYPFENSTTTIPITIQISATTVIDATPSAIWWNALLPGTEAGSGGNNQTAEGTWNVQIENIGSRNVTKIWLNNTYEASRPFATGLNASYDAGNMVVVAKENNTNMGYYFPNRVEYNESRKLVYVYVNESEFWSYGRFRNTSYEWFWAVRPNSSGQCGAGATLRVGNTAHTAAVDGSTNFLEGSGQYVQSTLVASQNEYPYQYGVTNVTLASVEKYCVAVRNDCNQVWFYKWNMGAPGASDVCTRDDAGNGARYIWDNSRTATSYDGPWRPMTPGDSTYIRIRARIPYGVHYGYLTTGYLWIIAQDV
jgi:hypothetical protein